MSQPEDPVRLLPINISLKELLLLIDGEGERKTHGRKKIWALLFMHEKECHSYYHIDVTEYHRFGKMSTGNLVLCTVYPQNPIRVNSKRTTARCRAIALELLRSIGRDSFFFTLMGAESFS
ncbi:unnamed protein product [Victoria cruziana]